MLKSFPSIRDQRSTTRRRRFRESSPRATALAFAAQPVHDSVGRAHSEHGSLEFVCSQAEIGQLRAQSPERRANLVRNWLFARMFRRRHRRDRPRQPLFAAECEAAYAERFARDASYSTCRPVYSPPDANGVQSIFLAREWWANAVACAPSFAAPCATRPRTIDSTVDNRSD